MIDCRPSAKDKDAASKIQKADFILVSHGHNDHIGEAVDIAKRTGAKLVANAKLAETLVEVVDIAIGDMKSY